MPRRLQSGGATGPGSRSPYGTGPILLARGHRRCGWGNSASARCQIALQNCANYPGEGLAQSDAGPEPGAQCGSSARWDMCGGRPKGRSLRVSDLRAVNARLREVIAGQGTLLAAQDARIDTQARHIRAQGEWIDTQAQLEAQGELVETLEAQVAELERRLGMDSSNSSTPPSQDRPEAAAE